MFGDLAQGFQDAGGFLLGQQVDLQVEMIAPFRAMIHRILPDQDKGREQHRLERHQGGQQRERIRVEWRAVPGHLAIPAYPEPDNPALVARAAEVTKLRAENKPTIPVLLGEEKKSNVFLRADEPSVAAKLHMKGANAADVFGELRERKNKS